MTTPQEGTGTCCEKCLEYIPESPDAGETYCVNATCPCHSPNAVQESTEEWEEEFDRRFPLRYSNEPKPLMISCIEHHAPASPAEIKQFIREARTLALQEAAITIRAKKCEADSLVKDVINDTLEDAAREIEALYKDKT